jgi:hypothetical protein
MHTLSPFHAVTRAIAATRRHDVQAGATDRRVRLMLAVTDGVLFHVEETNLRQSRSDDVAGVGEHQLPRALQRAVARALGNVASLLEDGSHDRDRVASLMSDAGSEAITGVQAIELLFSAQAALLERLSARSDRTGPQATDRGDASQHVRYASVGRAGATRVDPPRIVPEDHAPDRGASVQAVA